MREPSTRAPSPGGKLVRAPEERGIQRSSDSAHPSNPLSWMPPGRILAITMSGIFLAEVVAMALIKAIRLPSYPIETLLDAVILTLLIFPVLYYLSFRPLTAQIEERRQAEEALSRTNFDLEGRILERTGEMVRLNEALQLELSERKQVQESLQNALAASEQRKTEVSALQEGTRAVLDQSEFPTIARAIFEACKRLTGASAGYIALAEEELNGPIFLDSGDYSCSVDLSLPMPMRGYREQAYRSGKTVYHNRFSETEWVQLLPEGRVGLEYSGLLALLLGKAMLDTRGLGWSWIIHLTIDTVLSFFFAASVL